MCADAMQKASCLGRPRKRAEDHSAALNSACPLPWALTTASYAEYPMQRKTMQNEKDNSLVIFV